MTTATTISKTPLDPSHQQEHLPRRPLIPVLLTLELYKRGEEQDHVPALVHDGSPTVRAADLARQLVARRLLCGVVPDEVVVAVGEVYVGLVEDGGPLEGGAWQRVSTFYIHRRFRAPARYFGDQEV